MGAFYQILIPLLSLFLVREDLTDLFPLKYEAHLLRIYDGDTVQLRVGKRKLKLRLAKIDSPEKGQRFLKSNLDAGEFSRKCLGRLLSQKERKIIEVHGQDMYGRLLGDINELALVLVEEGCTTIYPHARFSSKSEKYEFLRAQKKAKALHRGLWRYGGVVTPKVWRKLNKRNANQR